MDTVQSMEVRMGGLVLVDKKKLVLPTSTLWVKSKKVIGCYVHCKAYWSIM